MFVVMTIFLATAVSAVANVGISYDDGSHHKNLNYNEQATLLYTVTGVFYPVEYETNSWEYGTNNLMENFPDATGITWSPIFEDSFTVSTADYYPGSYEIEIWGMDQDGQYIINPTITTFTITQPVPTLTIDPNGIIIYVGQTQTFTAAGGYGYEWSVSGPCSIQSTQGSQAEIQGNGVGTCDITVDDTGSPGTATAQMGIISLPNIYITHPNNEMFISQEETFTAHEGTDYLWEITSSNCIATSGSTGTTFTVKGTSEGMCNVKVTDIPSNAEAIDSIEVLSTTNVMTLIPQYVTAYPGESKQFTATGAIGSYNWQISPSQDCAITPNGNTATAMGTNPNTDCIITVQDTLGLGELDATLDLISLPTVYITHPNTQMFISQEETFTAHGGTDYVWQILTAYCFQVGGNTGTTFTVKGISEGDCDVRVTDIPTGIQDTASVEFVKTTNLMTLTPQYITAYQGEQKQFTATGALGNYDWGISPSQFCSITPNGNTAMASGIEPSIDCIITVQDTLGLGELDATLDVESVTVVIDPSHADLFLNPGYDYKQFNASGGLCGNEEDDYSWSVADSDNSGNSGFIDNLLSLLGIRDTFPSAGNCVIGEDTGYLVASAIGSCVVTAQDRCSSAFDTATVTIHNMPSVIVTPNPDTLLEGAQHIYTATGGFSGTYLWDITDGSNHCAFTGNPSTSDTTELVGVSIGNCTLKATDTASGAYDYSYITVVDASVDVQPEYSEILVADSVLLEATGGYTGNYLWSFVSGGIHCTLVDNGEGVQILGKNVTVIGNSVGVCVIKAKDSGSGLFDTAIVNVTQVTNVSLEIIPPYAQEVVNQGYNFTAINGDSGIYSWTMLSGDCSFTENNNDVVEVTGFSQTICNIQVEDNGEFATAILNVTNGTAPTIIVIPPEANLTVGQNQQFNATGGCAYIWTVSGPCSITQTGFLTALAQGQCTVYAYDQCSTGVGTANVTVTNGTAPTIIVIPPEANLTVGQNQQFNATGGCGYDWNVTGPCSINQSGFLTALGAGQCIVFANDQCSTGYGTANVTVTEPGQIVITVTPSPIILNSNVYQQFTATGGCGYTWAVTGPCSINQSGMLVTYNVGTCIVTAFDQCSNASGNAYVKVINGSNYPISAEIIANPTSGEKPLYVSFEGVGTGYGNLTYEWNFGYPNPLVYGKYVYYTYMDQGTYAVYLTVIDELGQTATDVEYITVLSHGQAKDSPRARIMINTLYLTNEGYIFPGNQAEWYIAITNTGNELDDFKISAVVPELGIYQSLHRFDFDDTVSRFLALDIPYDAMPGLYAIHFTFSNDEYRRVVHRDFIIE